MAFLFIFSLLILGAAIMVTRRPNTSLVILYCLFAFEQWAQAQNALFIKHSWLINVLAGLIVLLAARQRFVRGPDSRSTWTFGAVLVWSFFCFALLSVSWSEYPYALDRWIGKAPYLLLTLLVVPWIVRGSTDLTGVYVTLLVVGLIVTVLIFTTTDWSGRVIDMGEGGYGKRSEVVRGNPLQVATVAGLTAVVAALYGPKDRRVLWSVLRLAAIVLGLIVAIRTGSRGQVLAAFVVVLPMLMVKNKVTSPRSFMAAGLFGVIGLSVAGLAINHYWSGKRFSRELAVDDWNQRFTMSTDMLSAWFNHSNPLTIFFGLGSTSSAELIQSYPHILAIEILTEMGVIGLALIISALIWLLFRTIRRLRSRQLEAVERDTIYLSASIFFFFFLLSFKQSNHLNSYGFFLSAMVLAGLVGIRKKARNISASSLD